MTFMKGGNQATAEVERRILILCNVIFVGIRNGISLFSCYLELGLTDIIELSRTVVVREQLMTVGRLESERVYTAKCRAHKLQ